jgi:hypothetical protein
VPKNESEQIAEQKTHLSLPRIKPRLQGCPAIVQPLQDIHMRNAFYKTVFMPLVSLRVKIRNENIMSTRYIEINA